MLLGLLLLCLLRSNKVEENWEAEADNADARENCTLDIQSNVTKDQRHDGEVSVGEVAEVKPMRVKTGMHSAGKKVMSRPWTKEPAMQPLMPPSALPKTPAVAPQKK